MSVEYDRSPSEPEQDILHLVCEQFEQTQASFLDTAAQWAKLPLGKNLSLVANTATVSAEAYQNLATAIIYDEDLDKTQKAAILPRLTLEASASRVQTFTRLVPSGEFKVSEEEDNLAETISTHLEECHDLDEIIQECINTYTLSLDANLRMLIEQVQSGRRAKLISLATNSHLLEIIKLSSAATIGGVVAQLISKRIDKPS